ncbi:hypothetical protein [Burkholderia lata]|uniref:hypothetical protein n=1 Tax=Burkholderia lata (strain ATCC 17760 / DSM 23089 / LMG 22485 / NCIMB 9086 / R18194 / 383) TaxID=482957 RepID=UPI0014536C32|nr:hypothetical protein [Burkholderia lata]VWB88348.1 hypothetical protein BLA15816_04247 [Burkholderia lata]
MKSRIASYHGARRMVLLALACRVDVLAARSVQVARFDYAAYTRTRNTFTFSALSSGGPSALVARSAP